MMRRQKVWVVTLIIWGVGAALLWYALNNQIFANRALYLVVGYILLGCSIFYLLALVPIHAFVDRHVFKPETSANGNSDQ